MFSPLLPALLVTLSLLTAPAGAGEDKPATPAPLSLNDCIERGIAANPELQAYKLKVEEAAMGVRAAWGEFLPSIGLSYNRTLLKNNGGEEKDQDYFNSTTTNINYFVEQPLLSGFSSIAEIRKARRQKEYQQLEETYATNRLRNQISLRFFDWVRASRHVQLWSRSIERLKNQQTIVTEWVNQRLAPALRLLEVSVELSNARHSLIRAQSEQKSALAGLRELLNIRSPEPLLLTGDFGSTDEALCTAEQECQDLALNHRPELGMARLSIEIAVQQGRIILARNLPQVYLRASYTDYIKEYDTPVPINEEESISETARDYYDLILSIKFTPVQGGRNFFEYRRQRIAVRRMQQSYAQQLNAILTEVGSRLQQINENYAAILTSRKTLEEARTAYDMAFKATELGVSSLRELLDAELRLTGAEISLTNAGHGLAAAKKQLEYATGVMRDIAPAVHEETKQPEIQ